MWLGVACKSFLSASNDVIEGSLVVIFHNRGRGSFLVHQNRLSRTKSSLGASVVYIIRRIVPLRSLKSQVKQVPKRHMDHFDNKKPTHMGATRAISKRSYARESTYT